MTYQKWTPQEDVYVIDSYEARRRLSAVAEKLGRTVSSVKARINALGLERRRWTSRDSQVLKTMWLAGEKIAVIATTIGQPDSAVAYRRKILGLPARPNPAQARRA